MKYSKMLTIDTEPKHASERMVTLLNSNLPHGRPSRLIRDWTTVGYLLDEMNIGLKEFLLSTDKHNINPQDRLNRLLQFINLCLREKPVAHSSQPQVVTSQPETSVNQINTVATRRRSLAE